MGWLDKLPGQLPLVDPGWAMPLRNVGVVSHMGDQQLGRGRSLLRGCWGDLGQGEWDCGAGLERGLAMAGLFEPRSIELRSRGIEVTTKTRKVGWRWPSWLPAVEGPLHCPDQGEPDNDP